MSMKSVNRFDRLAPHTQPTREKAVVANVGERTLDCSIGGEGTNPMIKRGSAGVQRDETVQMKRTKQQGMARSSNPDT